MKTNWKWLYFIFMPANFTSATEYANEEDLEFD